MDSPYPSYFEINIHCNDSSGVIYKELESKIDFKDTLMRLYAYFSGVHEEFIEFIKNYLLYVLAYEMIRLTGIKQKYIQKTNILVLIAIFP